MPGLGNPHLINVDRRQSERAALAYFTLILLLKYVGAIDQRSACCVPVLF